MTSLAPRQQRRDATSISCRAMFSIITSSGCPLPLWFTPKYPLLSVLHKKGPHSFSIPFRVVICKICSNMSKPTHRPSPPKTQVKNTESVDECATDVSIIPCTVMPSHRLDKFLPTAKIAFGTGMQYGPEQSIPVSICQNTFFPFCNAPDC